MKGFKKDGKFRPTESRKKSSLSKSDLDNQKMWASVQRKSNEDNKKIWASVQRKSNEDNRRIWQGVLNRDKQTLDDISSSEYAPQLEKLQEEFPDMMESIAEQKGCDYKEGNFVFKGTNTKLETVCGASTTKLFSKLPSLGLSYSSFKIEGGVYQGDGLKDGEVNRGHQWIRLDDGTIIDGSHGQFKDEVNHPDDRLEIVTSDDPRQVDFVAQYEQNPFTQTQKYYTNYDEIKKQLKTQFHQVNA